MTSHSAIKQLAFRLADAEDPDSDAILENRLLTRWSHWYPRCPRQLGAIHESDAELVATETGMVLAFTVDSVIEEIRSGLYRDPYTSGYVAVIASLSDLAAVGAVPFGVLLSVTLPHDDRAAVQERVAQGASAAACAAKTWILGGDTNQDDRLAITSAAMGYLSSPMPLRRVGMRPGDDLFLSGPLGSGAALAAVNLFNVASTGFTEVNFRPQARLREGQILSQFASATMDTSDGLIATLDQLGRLNKVALHLDVPLERYLHPAAAEVRRAMGLPCFPFVASLHGEFELVFSVPRSRAQDMLEALQQIDSRPLRIGSVREGSGLALGEVPIDGASVRNLWQAVGGDARAYLSGLCALGPKFTA